MDYGRVFVKNGIIGAIKFKFYAVVLFAFLVGSYMLYDSNMVLSIFYSYAVPFTIALSVAVATFPWFELGYAAAITVFHAAFTSEKSDNG